jgi:hypothetical protein
MKLQLEPGKTYTIGCDEGAALRLSDPLVLKGHCSLEVANGAVILRNHTATAGTFVGDQKVSQATLKANSAFRIGETTLAILAAPPPPPPPKAPDPYLGRIVGGYKLNELVGEGGMGKVYRATQLSLHRDVALKVLRDQLAKDKGFRDLFINEARSAAQLVHSNVVQVYDAGVEGDVVFFSMEYLGQGSVEEILEKEKRIPWEQAILQVLEAAHGLAYAESKGIVHRDIKPDNLMLNEDGRVKIADLGLAKRGEGPQDKGVIGTPHFIPPEQALGKQVDHRADIYSLGATFFRMITGRTLFSGKTAKEIVLKHIKEPPPAASSVDDTVPDDLDLVLAKMLAKDPDQRYQSATEVIAALEEVCAHHGIKGAIIKRGVGKRVLIPLIALLVVAGGAIYYFATKEDPAALARQRALQEQADKAAKDAEEAREREAAQTREKRKSEAAYRLQQRQTMMYQLKSEVPFESVYEDPAKAPALEGRWIALARDFEIFAESDDAQEFEKEIELASKATNWAKEIRTTLNNWKESSQDRIEKRNAKLKEAEEIDKKLRRDLADLRLSKEYEQAANLCDLVANGKPPKDDPFRAIETWEWVSPMDSSTRQSALLFPDIKRVVQGSREYFKSEENLIVETAKKEGRQAIDDAKALPEEAPDADIRAAIKKLAEVRAFGIDGAGRRVQDITDLIEQARGHQTKLESLLAARAAKLLAADRIAARNQQRDLCSLEDQIQNAVMSCEYQEAIGKWQALLVGGGLRTDTYVRFAKERIAMIRWCEYLFARFHADLDATAKGVGDKKPFRTLDVDRVPFPGREMTDQTLSSKGAERYTFGLVKSFDGQSVFPYGKFPMDWVYHSILQSKGGPRWTEMSPDLHFALAAFCFETMQYKAALGHLEEVLKSGDKRLEEAARSLRERAARERDAREAWEKMCEEAETLESSADLNALTQRLQAYPQAHEGTLFFLDVMDRKDDPAKDFFSAEYPEVPAPPTPPEPPR